MPIHFSIFLRSFHSLLRFSFHSGSFLSSLFRSLIFLFLPQSLEIACAAHRTERNRTAYRITSHHNNKANDDGRNVEVRERACVRACMNVRFYLSISIASLMAQYDIPIRKCCQFTRRNAFLSVARSVARAFSLFCCFNTRISRKSKRVHMVCICVWCVSVCVNSHTR